MPLIVNTTNASSRPPRSSGQPQRQASPTENTTPAEVAAEALYKRLGELAELDRELNSLVDEKERRVAEFTKVNQSYNAHRMQRALEAWRYYAQQLQEKQSTCTDPSEAEQLERKSEEVSRRIQALEEVIPAACAQQQQELQALDDTIDNLQVKRNVLLKIIRGLQEETNAASVPRRRSPKGPNVEERDDEIPEKHHHADGEPFVRGHSTILQRRAVPLLPSVDHAAGRFSSGRTTPRLSS